MTFLDSCRHPYFPDDILVFLVNGDGQAEGCWARISGQEEDYFSGRLLNEPEFITGFHYGDAIHFKVLKEENGEIKCYAMPKEI